MTISHSVFLWPMIDDKANQKPIGRKKKKKKKKKRVKSEKSLFNVHTNRNKAPQRNIVYSIDWLRALKWWLRYTLAINTNNCCSKGRSIACMQLNKNAVKVYNLKLLTAVRKISFRKFYYKRDEKSLFPYFSFTKIVHLKKGYM